MNLQYHSLQVGQTPTSVWRYLLYGSICVLAWLRAASAVCSLNQLVAENTNLISLPGGLVAGHPLVMRISLLDTFVSLNFMLANKQWVAFMLEIRFSERSVVSNSFLGYWGAENRDTPHFDFTYGQVVTVFCVVNSASYHVYIDKVLFKKFDHRVPPDQVRFTSYSAAPSGGGCQSMAGGRAACGVLCNIRPLCKLVFDTCNTSGQCTCTFCDQLTGIAFSQTGTQTYLDIQLLAQNTQSISLPAGLIIGHPLIMTISLQDVTLNLLFKLSNGYIGFLTAIRFNERTVVSNSFLGQWGPEDRYTPHFNFQIGQVISVFCVVAPAHYELYIDRILFKRFPHRVDPTLITQIVLDVQFSRIVTFER
ncbi:hypothetical protein EGW08_009320 [Elysia chlorotica]|uniref:Galectin n=1 Tax=Elysia chlorotica TaxID=188477 RepID=A0A433TN61_ELYCH|nr:hypothetical protein EGW08_009320 [Elysia chlorotica]